MNDNASEYEEPSEAVIFVTGVDVAEKYHREATVNEKTIAQTKSKFEAHKKDLETSVLDDIRKAHTQFQLFVDHRDDEETYTSLKRLVLGIKSNAGMADFPVATEIASLLFELFDDDYDLNKDKVINSVALYLETLEELVTRELSPETEEERVRLIEHFERLNHQIA